MAVCNDKICEAVIGCCESLKPSLCGVRGVVMPETSCKQLRLEGVDDVTINQGIGIDLADGVHAYDGDGNEIEVVIDPNEIDKCDVGIHSVKYTAMGKGDSRRPVICGKNALDIGTACDDLTSIEAVRTVTIEQIDPPTISGIEDMEVADGTVFDPMDGVSAVDGNGNSVDVEFEGDYPVAVSGEIVTFDNESSKPARSLKVALEPIQDLNGYDKPWVGGAGKNKVDITSATVSAQTILYSVSLNAGTYTLSAICTNNTSISGYLSIRLNGVAKGTVTIGSGDSGTRKSATFTISEDASYDVVGSGASSGYNFTVSNVQLESGSTMTDFAPYSNICPISGHTEADAYVTGINVWDEEWELGGVDNITGEPTTETNKIRSKNFISILPSKNYYAYVGNSAPLGLRFYDADKTFIGINSNAKNTVFTTPSNAYFMKFANGGSSVPITTYNNDISINYPSTDTEYHAYEGQTYHTDLGQTVYGGTLDVVSGELVVDRAKFWMQSSPKWDRLTTQNPNGTVFRERNDAVNDLVPWAEGREFAMSNVFTPSALDSPTMATQEANSFRYYTDSQGYGRLVVVYGEPNGGTSLTEFKQALTEMGAYFIAKLEEPEIYWLTPQQINALIGVNNVWADDSDNVEVVYTKALPQSGSVTLLEGVYYVTYTAEDECGNKTEVTRRIVVGDGNKLCKMRLCEGFADCSQNRTCEAYTCQAYTACE